MKILFSLNSYSFICYIRSVPPFFAQYTELLTVEKFKTLYPNAKETERKVWEIGVCISVISMLLCLSKCRMTRM